MPSEHCWSTEGILRGGVDDIKKPFPFKIAIRVQDGVVSDPRNTVLQCRGEIEADHTPSQSLHFHERK